MSKQFIRSPSYPGLPLDEAVDLVGRIEQRYRSAAVDRTDAAKLIGFSSLSGPANRALAALAGYGLLERAGKGDTRVTERARAILHPGTPEEKRANLADAGATPPLFQKLRERFPNIAVPPEDGVVTYLNRQNFNPNSVKRAARAFLRTAEYLEELGVPDGHASEATDEAESPNVETEEVLVGDIVQWESQGVLQFAEPRRVREISDDGQWAFVEGSQTGMAVGELTTVERPDPKSSPPTPPTLPVDRVDLGEVEWLRSQVGRNTTVRLLVTGDVGAREVERLIRVLQTQHEVLSEDEGE